MIEINEINKKYDNFKLNIKNVSFEDGEIIGILGKNGSGKTTLVEILLGLIKTKKINIKFSKDYKVNAIFQESSFDGNFKIIEILKMYSKIYNLKNQDLDSVLETYELTALKFSKYKKLSSGQKQKVKICVAFMNNPDFLVLDEVTTSLDLSWQKKIINIIKQYCSDNPNALILLITHSLNDVKELCDKALILEKGKVKAFIAMDKKDPSKTINNIEGEIYENA